MSKRCLYTDPIAAIWMAKHFGMKFSVVEFTGKSSGGKGDYSVRKEYTLYPSPFCNKDGLATCKTDRGGELIGPTSLFRFRNEFFVHADSLPLLEPQAGDLITWEYPAGDFRERHSYEVITDGHNHNHFPADAKRLIEETGAQIVMRRGVLFHWPESKSE